ncbi:ECF RNA polymerase sigma factor SigR [Planctomycetes bacterium Poly30]|uniref:ECF RNA polymerase sigma factor SigR n=1 Tax=Saltatorellus ferox TaxID=2528018 RepID=A0A518EKW9_9BACT|nr:ECF RNA polymerase sigma factor SigR [Planctomycetes bacterium Poly30]
MPDFSPTSESPTTGLEGILQQMDRVRAMARVLVQDASDADDLVQSAVVAALRNEQPLGGSPMAWMRVVLRNLQRNEARGRRSRAQREAESARSEVVQSAGEGAESAELARDVAEAVLALREPYRTVITLRHFEDLPPREIALRTGTNVEAVRKQITRGQTELQHRLEARYGDRGAWAVALLPLTGRDGVGLGLSAMGAGGFLVRGIGLLLLVGAALLGVWTMLDSAPPANPTWMDPVSPLVAVDPGAPATATTLPGPRALDVPRVAGVEQAVPHAVATPDGSEAASSESAPAPQTFRAQVVDLKGQSLPGVELKWVQRGRQSVQTSANSTTYEELPAWRWRRVRLVSDPGGWIQIDRYPSEEKLNETWALEDETRTILGIAVDMADRHLIVVAPAVRISGTVLDTEGNPVPGIRVGFSASIDSLTTFPWMIKREHSVPGVTTHYRQDGAFRIERAPTHPDFRIQVIQGSLYLADLPPPLLDTPNFDVVVPARSGTADPKERSYRIHGRVEDAAGAGLPGVLVRCGGRETRSDARGDFRFEFTGTFEDELSLIARRADGWFTTGVGPTMAEARSDGVTAPVTLRFPERTLGFLGQVVDAGGAPLKGMNVYVVDGTQLGRNTFAWFEHWRQGADWLDPFQTDARGLFRVPHVLDRPYWLRVIDPRTLFVHDVKGVRASDGLIRIRLPADRTLPEVKGVVLDHFGQPVPKARVMVRAEIMMTLDRRTAATCTDPVLTNAAGEFLLRDVPWRDVELQVLPPDGIGATAATAPLDAGSAVGLIQLSLDLECRLRLALPGRPDVEALEFLSDAGEPARVIQRTPSYKSYTEHIELPKDRRALRLDVRQSTSTLVLVGATGELERIPLHLLAGEDNAIEL